MSTAAAVAVAPPPNLEPAPLPLSQPAVIPWSPARRFGFRLLFVYVALFSSARFTAPPKRPITKEGTSQPLSEMKDGQIELWTDDPAQHLMKVALPDAKHLVLSGTFVGIDEEVKVTLKRIDDNNFVLRNHGFHLVSETPFSR